MKSSKSRILFVLHTPPPVHGAAVVGQYIKNSKVINETFKCRYINLSTSTQIDKIGKNGIIKFIRYINILLKVIYDLVVYRPDLCYVTLTAKGSAFFKDAVVVFIVKLFRVKPVYHFHNKGITSKQDKFLYNIFYTRIFSRSNVILLSKYLYYDVQKYMSPDRVHYCPNGIPDNDKNKTERNESFVSIKSSNQNKSSIGTDTVEILFLSNLIESKGVYILLEACKLLRSKHIRFHCTFVGGEGDITSHNFNKKVEEMDLSHFVDYIGKKYGADKQKVFNESDVFVLPTYYHNECFPLVLLEAMQHGLPVISTFEGGIRDIVEDGKTGFLIEKNKILELAEKLEELINDKSLRKSMGNAGRMKYEKEFTYDIFEQRMKHILTKITNSKKLQN